MTVKTAAIAAALCTAAVAAPTAQGAAKAPVYELTLRGSEALSWTYKPAGDGRCFHGGDGFGSQEVIYKLNKVKVKAVKPKSGDLKGLAQLVPLNDRLAEHGYVTGIDAHVEATREGEYKSSAECGGTGGGDTQPPPSDCGPRFGRITLTAGFIGRGSFGVSGKYGDFERPAGDFDLPPVPGSKPPTGGDALGSAYGNCPFILPSGMRAAYDELTPAPERLSAKRLPAKGRTLKLSGGTRKEYLDDDRTGETSVAWNMKLKRVK